MVGKLTQATVVNNVSIESDVSFEYFENFQQVLDWCTEGDGWIRVVSDKDSEKFANGGELELMEIPAEENLPHGVFPEYNTISVEFYGFDETPSHAFWATGDNGTIIATSSGDHIDTVWGKGFFQDDMDICEQSPSVFLQEFMRVCGSLEENDTAIEYAYNCVDFDISEKHSDMKAAISEYVGG